MNSAEQSIIQRICNGETKLFAILVDRYKNKAMNMAMNMLRNTHDAEDSVQEAFLRAYRALDTFAGNASFSTWFYRIVYNICLNELEKKKKSPRLEAFIYGSQSEENSADSMIQLADTSLNPQEYLEIQELQNHLDHALRKIPPLHATALLLCVQEEKKYEEIGQIMNIPAGTAKTYVHRARLALRKTMISGENHDAR
jgi:RNA polymerase sigma-70 factor (ECF subfamily)